MDELFVTGMLVVGLLDLKVTIAMTFVDAVAMVDVTAASTIVFVVAARSLRLVVLSPGLLLVEQKVRIEDASPFLRRLQVFKLGQLHTALVDPEVILGANLHFLLRLDQFGLLAVAVQFVGVRALP